jgi:hypothetical protein
MIVSGNNDIFDNNSMDLQMSNSIQYIISGIKSKATQRNYLVLLEQFRAHFKIGDYDSLLTYKPELSDLFKEYEKFSDRLVVSKEARLESKLLRKDKILEENQA